MHAVSALKETGTRVQNRLKVVRFNRSWFGENLAVIHNFYNCPFNIFSMWEVLSRLKPKAFELSESFWKWVRLAGLSAVAAPGLLAFQKKLVHWFYIWRNKSADVGPGRLQKLLVQGWEICYPIGAKELKLPLSKSFEHINKLMALNS